MFYRGGGRIDRLRGTSDRLFLEVLVDGVDAVLLKAPPSCSGRWQEGGNELTIQSW
jgi:hypothetical protein